MILGFTDSMATVLIGVHATVSGTGDGMAIRGIHGTIGIPGTTGTVGTVGMAGAGMVMATPTILHGVGETIGLTHLRTSILSPILIIVAIIQVQPIMVILAMEVVGGIRMSQLDAVRLAVTVETDKPLGVTIADSRLPMVRVAVSAVRVSTTAPPSSRAAVRLVFLHPASALIRAAIAVRAVLRVAASAVLVAVVRPPVSARAVLAAPPAAVMAVLRVAASVVLTAVGVVQAVPAAVAVASAEEDKSLTRFS